HRIRIVPDKQPKSVLNCVERLRVRKLMPRKQSPEQPRAVVLSVVRRMVPLGRRNLPPRLDVLSDHRPIVVPPDDDRPSRPDVGDWPRLEVLDDVVLRLTWPPLTRSDEPPLPPITTGRRSERPIHLRSIG